MTLEFVSSPPPTRMGWISFFSTLGGCIFTFLTLVLAFYLALSWKDQQRNELTLKYQHQIMEELTELVHDVRYFVNFGLIEEGGPVEHCYGRILVRSDRLREVLIQSYLSNPSNIEKIEDIIGDLALKPKGDYLDSTKNLIGFLKSVGNRIEFNNIEYRQSEYKIVFHGCLKQEERDFLESYSCSTRELKIEEFLGVINKALDQAVLDLKRN